MPEAAEQVLVLPAHVEVDLGSIGVELETAAEQHALELLGVHADDSGTTASGGGGCGRSGTMSTELNVPRSSTACWAAARTLVE